MTADKRKGLWPAWWMWLLLCPTIFAGKESLGAVMQQPNVRYEPNWASLDSRPLPGWFNEAKFGIFVVWGPYSVPAWKDRGYAEWYGNRMNQKASATWKFHRRVYGEHVRYEDFAKMFKAELWDPNSWCDLFKRAGARYVVTTANYHDGFAMWPTKYARFNETQDWNCLDRGPKRDIIGELKAAGEARGLKMGIYYSFYEWYHPLWKNAETQSRFVTEHLHPKFKEVVTQYKPWFIFLDGEWAADHAFWRSAELAAWLYNESPCKDYVVANDRWGRTRGIHGDVFESEYGGGESCSPDHPWQEDRGMAHSYGYNRAEGIDDYDTAADMIRMLSRCTAGGGNYLLCVGPTGDGRIPVIMQQRLVEIGDWLKLHGEAIYGANASPFWPRQFEWGHISAKAGKLYLHVFDRDLTRIELTGLGNTVSAAAILGHPNTTGLRWRQDGNRLIVEWPWYLTDEAVTVIRLDVEGRANADTTQHQFADGEIRLSCRAMEIHGTKARAYYGGFGRTVRIREWIDPNEYLTAMFDLTRAGDYVVRVTYAASRDQVASQPQTPSRFVLETAEQQLEHTIVNTGGQERFRQFRIGEVRLDSAGRHTLTIRPVAAGWRSLGLQSITLSPQRPR